ncbi:MAG: hypothetical protein CVV27_05070 [Candidatus Melainabacteria bacterium HGW-Melainabacteria-1]|nr:MAG: hypothetical protein CVV27_05070 [Candidatus Melainabacteria bacterium HGW-Melainabacteria-1]
MYLSSGLLQYREANAFLALPLRRLAPKRLQPESATAQSIVQAPVNLQSRPQLLFDEAQIQDMKQLCRKSGDVLRLRLLEAYEGILRKSQLIYLPEPTRLRFETGLQQALLDELHNL